MRDARLHSRDMLEAMDAIEGFEKGMEHTEQRFRLSYLLGTLSGQVRVVGSPNRMPVRAACLPAIRCGRPDRRVGRDLMRVSPRYLCPVWASADGLTTTFVSA